MSDQFVQIVTTTANQDEARKIAAILVERHLAACVQIAGPIESTYRWQGKIETAIEWQCSIKARRSSFAAVEKCIREVHSYEVPEILALPVVDISGPYAQWLRDSTQ
jgi:periplasmic divalent cation tolerance protein